LAAATAEGGGLTVTVRALAVAVAPSASVTVRIGEYVPAPEYVWLGLWRVEFVASPKAHAKL
jgi:hypothetical protein